MRALTLCLALLLTTFSSSTAFAQRMTAAQHYARGAEHFDRGQFQDAAREFQAAFAISRSPVLLYNIARALGNLNEIEGALDAYRGFRAAGCPESTCIEIDEAIHLLEARRVPPLPTTVQVVPTPHVVVPPIVIPDTRPVPQPVPGTILVAHHPIDEHRLPTRPTEMSSINRYGPWVAMGTGLVLGAFSIQQGLTSLSDRGIVSDSANGSRAYTSEVEQAQARMGDESSRAIILGVSGGVAFLSGVLWTALRPHPHVNESAPVIQPIVGYNSLGIGGSF